MVVLPRVACDKAWKIISLACVPPVILLLAGLGGNAPLGIFSRFLGDPGKEHEQGRFGRVHFSLHLRNPLKPWKKQMVDWHMGLLIKVLVKQGLLTVTLVKHLKLFFLGGLSKQPSVNPKQVILFNDCNRLLKSLLREMI